MILSLFSSHYSERYLIGPLTSLKYLVLFSSLDRFDEKEDEVYTKYSFLDSPVLNPVHIAQQAFKGAEKYLFEKYFSSELSYLYNPDEVIDKQKILTTADFFITHYPENEINGTSLIRLPYNFYYPSYDLKKPWYSGMAQGLATVVLLAAYDITLEQRYLTAAEKIGLTLSIPINEGGTLINVGKQGLWHEEYADLTKNSHPKVLNGNNFAIDGVFWLKKVTQNLFWDEFLTNSIKGLNSNIHLYDGFFWSKYGLMGNYANWKYHSIHILQLNKISKIYSQESTADVNNIVEYTTKFEFYKSIPLGFTERLIFQSNNMLFAVIFINWFFLIMLLSAVRKVKSIIG